MSKIQNEGYIDKSPIPVSIKDTEKIIDQMKKCVCKIKNDKVKGTGFFSKIPYKNELKNVLITCNHILDENDIKNGNILLSINNEETYKNIKIEVDDNRLIFTDKDLDITIIEIIKKDNIENNINSYLEVDKRLKFEFIKEIYQKESLYILNYPKGEDIVVSYGILNDINNKEIYHNCSTEQGSSGSPIISLKTFQLIGIHKASCLHKNLNKGLFIKYVIDELNKIKIKKFILKIENNLMNIFNKIENKIINTENNQIKEITILYKIDKKYSKMRIFGKNFVKNNKKKCKMIIEGHEEKIKEFINVDETLKNKYIFEIKLKDFQNITDMSYMFSNNDLYEYNGIFLLPDISKWDTKNITNMSYMFNNCKDLSSLPEISKIDTKNVTNMSFMFSNCCNLEYLPDISKWDTKNCTNMSYMFDNCNKLVYLPGIYKWNTKNVTNMSYMFSNCHNLVSLPDISKWDTKNVIDISDMFSNCHTLESLPDISKWKTQNFKDIRSMFYYCINITSLPDISKWNTKHVTNINYMFFNCKKLLLLPDISKWNTEKVTNMSYMFYDCSNLLSLPDISRWNTKNVVNLSYMFYNCNQLKSLPDISKWNTEKVTNVCSMFYFCSNLTSMPDISKWNGKNITNISYIFNKCDKLSSLPDISKWNIKRDDLNYACCSFPVKMMFQESS